MNGSATTLERWPGMHFIDVATHKPYSSTLCDAYRAQVGLCDVCVFILRQEPRVFVGGGQFGFDSLAREADLVEVEALAERFNSEELRQAAARIRAAGA